MGSRLALGEAAGVQNAVVALGSAMKVGAVWGLGEGVATGGGGAGVGQRVWGWVLPSLTIVEAARVPVVALESAMKVSAVSKLGGGGGGGGLGEAEGLGVGLLASLTIVEAAGVPHPVVASGSPMEVHAVGAIKHVDAVIGVLAGMTVHNVNQHNQA